VLGQYSLALDYIEKMQTADQKGFLTYQARAKSPVLRKACFSEAALLAALCPQQRAFKRHTVEELNIEPECNIYCVFSLSLRFWRVQYMGGMS
jgi:hypothetical protein